MDLKISFFYQNLYYNTILQNLYYNPILHEFMSKFSVAKYMTFLKGSSHEVEEWGGLGEMQNLDTCDKEKHLVIYACIYKQLRC